MNSARAFLSGIIDYAGLFPPASLDMESAVRSCAAYRAGPDSDLLGRFIVPASRLGEFSAAADDVLSGDGDKWRISAIAGDDLDASLSAVLEFNSRHAGATCDTIEARVTTSHGISSAAQIQSDSLRVFLEIPVTDDPRSLVEDIGRTGASAKIRTGGVVQSSIPSSHEILAFVHACVAARVPFKATAGLHHAVRGTYALTYEPGAPRAVLHGYLNVFIASAFTATGFPDIAPAVLDELDASAFRFDEAGAWWRDHVITHPELARVRDSVALSFGSCSFDEPVGEARQLHLI